MTVETDHFVILVLFQGVLPQLVLSGPAPPQTFLVIVLFVDYGLFNRTVETSGPVPATPCLSCTNTATSCSIEPGPSCPGAVWLGLSGEYAASILRDFAQQLHKATINFVCLSILLSVCLSLSYNSTCTQHIFVKISTGDI